MSFTDVKIKILDTKLWLGDVNDVMHRKRARRIWGILKKSQLVESCGPKKKGDFCQLAVALWRMSHVLGGRWKSMHRKIVPLSPYVENPLNSKVIKSFVPELRNRKCFSCFGIPMFYVFMLWTFYVRFPYPYHGYGTIILNVLVGGSYRRLSVCFSFCLIDLLFYVLKKRVNVSFLP